MMRFVKSIKMIIYALDYHDLEPTLPGYADKDFDNGNHERWIWNVLFHHDDCWNELIVNKIYKHLKCEEKVSKQNM